MFKTAHSKLTLLLLVTAMLFLSGFGCRVNQEQEQAKLPPENLEWWGVWYDTSDTAPLIDAYQKVYPHVAVHYRKLREEEYEQKMLEALAEDRGPDIFTIPSTGIQQYKKRIAPLSETTAVSFRPRNEKGELQKIITQTTPSLTVRDLRANFAPLIKNDVLLEGKIWGLPLSVNVMALYYNKQLLDESELYDPPANWSEFTVHVKKLTKIETDGTITQSGASLGAASNIPQAPDILALLMMQTGVKMLGQSGAVFQKEVEEASGTYNPGLAALKFYTDFANPSKGIYTWNETLPPALSAFEQGKTAFFIGYNYHLPLLKRDALGVDFGIAAIPQPAGSTATINIANYWVETVSAKSAHKDRAWHFLQFASSEKNASQLIQAKSASIPVLKSLLNTPPKDGAMKIFYTSALTAESWYRGKNYSAAQGALNEMITTTLKGDATAQEALDFGAQKVSQTLY